MKEERRKELFDLATSIANLTVLEYAYVKSLISTTKKSINKISVQQGDLKCN